MSAEEGVMRKEENYLDALEKKRPELAPMARFARQLTRESERGAVLIASGYIEELLKDLILNFMVEGNESRNLFAAGGCLASLSGRIKTAFSLGLLTESERNDLERMRWIRNQMAHNPDADFGDQAIQARCNAFETEADKERRLGGRHGRVVEVAIGLIVGLATRMEGVRKERRVVRKEFAGLFG